MLSCVTGGGSEGRGRGGGNGIEDVVDEDRPRVEADA